MINKEFIVGSGGIIKDFQDRNIPQNSNNFVSVGVLIPVSEFADLGTYGVCLATSKIVGGVETSLPSLICYSAKTLKIEGVDYIKYQCQLSIQYTNYIGQLKLTPYIIEIETLNEGEEDESVVITTQKTFTNTTLNVIRSIASTSDASLEESEAVDTLTALINDKKIKTIEDYKTGTKAQAIVGCFTDYNASSYEGWLLIVKYSGGEIALLPYKNGANNEFTEIDLDGSIYKLSDYSSGTYTSTLLTASKDYVDTNFYKKTETYSDDEVDALLSAKVDKTQKVNNHALSGDITISKSDVGLGNVENYGMVNSPSADATNKYVDAGGLYTYLITNYADKSDYDTTKQKVDELYESFKGTSDNDNVVNTLYDLIKVFENFDEADNVASILSGLDSRLDTMESMGNVVANVGSATLLTSGWASNSDSYSSDYPYKITYQNDLLIGASNFSVIFSVDAVSMGLCPTAVLDNTTGTITFYAVEIPSVDIDIENIVAFTTLNAINTLTTDTINQVSQNKNDIADLQQNKANKSDYVAKEEENTPSGWNFAIETSIGRKATTGGIDLKSTRKNTNSYSEISMPYGALQMKVHDNDGTETTLKVDKDGVYKNNTPIGVLFTSSTDATESGGVYTLDVSGITGIEVNDYIAYLNSGAFTTLYQVASISSGVATLNVVGSFGGGGSQLYQHNITIQFTSCLAYISIINDSNVAFTVSTLLTWFTNNGFTTVLNSYQITGYSTYSGYEGVFVSAMNDTTARINCRLLKIDGSVSGMTITTSNVDSFIDTVIAL